MKPLYAIAITIILLSACRADDGAVEAQTRLSAADTQVLIANCLYDRTENYESCACSLRAMEAYAIPAELDASLAAAKAGKPLPALAFDKTDQERWLAFAESKVQCNQISNVATIKSACISDGYETSACYCQEQALAEVMTDTEYIEILEHLNAQTPLSAPIETKMSQIMVTCTSWGGWPGKELLGSDATQ